VARFPYCLNASTIQTTPLLRQIEVAAAAGYEAIELWHRDINAHLRAQGTLRDIRQALDDHGLAVPTTIYLRDWFDTTGEVHTQAMQECRRRLEQAAELGALHVIASPPSGPADYERGAKRYRQLLEMGIALGPKPAMEFLGFVDQLNTIEDALEIVRQCGHPQASIILDPFHVFRGGGSMESIAQLDEHQIAISHFNDAPSAPPREQQHDEDRVYPGDGHLDLPRYVDLLWQTGYRGYLSLELFREDLWARDPLEAAREGLEKMREVVEA